MQKQLPRDDSTVHEGLKAKNTRTWRAFVGVGTTPMGPKLAMPMQTCPGPRRAGGRSGGRLQVLTKRCIAHCDYCCVVPRLQLHRTSRMKEKRNVFCDLDIRSTRRQEAGTGRCKAPAAPPRLFSRCTLVQAWNKKQSGQHKVSV